MFDGFKGGPLRSPLARLNDDELVRVITEDDIIAARHAVAKAEAAHEQMSFQDGLLGSAGLTPDMVKEWLGARVNVHWCACTPRTDPAQIVCATCGLPPYWAEALDES